MINSKIFQEIYNEIAVYLPNVWNRLVIYLEYGEDSYSFSFFYSDGKKYTKCYDIPSVSEIELMNSFDSINKLVSPERMKSNDKWSNMTMVIDADGHMSTDFDYSDLSNGTYQYKKEWKKKYLI